MEIWQRDNINSNLFNLIKLIKCNSLFFAALQEHSILSEEDVAEVESKPDSFKKAKHLLALIQIQTHGYKALLQALSLTKQTGAVKLLLKSVSPMILDDVKVNLTGRTFDIASVLTTEQRSQLWLEIREAFDSLELANFLFTYRQQNKEIKVDNNTIPPPIPYYIPRTLSKRLHIKPEIFKQKCNDIFVIEGIERSQLSALTNSEVTANSSDQLDGITVRFIKLDDRDDWEELRAISKSPIHLILYENETKSYVLQESSGDSGIIRHYMETLHKDDITISEEQLLDEVEKNTGKGICICDLPGMGKTKVLANLARNVSKNPSKVVVFIQLKYFVETVRLTSQRPDSRNAEILLLEYFTKTQIGAHILQKVVPETDLKFEVFFDGFDEISGGNVIWTKDFLKGLIISPHIKLYVTSRPHVRHELEDSLRVLAYDILPFSLENQTNFLTKYWGNEYPNISISNLEKFAKLCLGKFKENISANTSDIAGIPIQCRLIADIHKKAAFRNCKSDMDILEDEIVTFGKSFAEIYTKFIETTFSASDLPTLSENIPNQSTNDGYRHQIQKLALKEIFTEYSYAGLGFGENPSCEQENKHIMSFGLLEEVHNGENVVYQFIHRTIAEYMVAEFVVNRLLHNVKKNTSKRCFKKALDFFKPEGEIFSFCKFLFHTVFETQVTSYPNKEKTLFQKFHNSYPLFFIPGFYRFTFSTVMYFLDYFLKSLPESSYSQIANTFVIELGQDDIYNIIKCCVKDNLVNIFNLVENICKSHPKRYRMLATKEYLCGILLEISIYSSVEFLSKFISFSREFYFCTVDDIKRTCKNEALCSPLQLACHYKLFDLLEYFLTLKFTTECLELLHTCVRFSSCDNQKEINLRKYMISLLLETNPNLVNERDRFTQTPLSSLSINLQLITFLVQKGMDLYATDIDGYTLAHAHARWMNALEYHEFVIYLLHDLGAADLFNIKCQSGNLPLHLALRKITSLRWDTVQIILTEAKTPININDKNANGENLIFAAVKGCQEVEILKQLVEMGADYKIIDGYGNSLLDLCEMRQQDRDWTKIRFYLEFLNAKEN